MTDEYEMRQFWEPAIHELEPLNVTFAPVSSVVLDEFGNVLMENIWP